MIIMVAETRLPENQAGSLREIALFCPPDEQWMRLLDSTLLRHFRFSSSLPRVGIYLRLVLDAPESVRSGTLLRNRLSRVLLDS